MGIVLVIQVDYLRSDFFEPLVALKAAIVFRLCERAQYPLAKIEILASHFLVLFEENSEANRSGAQLTVDRADGLRAKPFCAVEPIPVILSSSHHLFTLVLVIVAT